jgi:iron-sulfur cluster assembly accessory protein
MRPPLSCFWLSTIDLASCLRDNDSTPLQFSFLERQPMSVAQFIPDSIQLTDRAARKVRELIDEEHNATLKLRVYITGGGCSGFQYGFSFDEELADDDTVIERDGVNLLVDPMSYQYLVGAEVDYTEGLEGSRFVVHNPNATTTCGCGSSFSI